MLRNTQFLEDPRKVESTKLQKGFAYVAAVERQGAKKGIFVPDSLGFNLAKECQIHGLPGPKGHRFVVGATIEDMPAKGWTTGAEEHQALLVPARRQG